MKTHYLNLPLLLPNQTNKEVILNEALTALDHFASNSVSDFADPSIITTSPAQDESYIILGGEKNHYIATYIANSNSWHFYPPRHNMVIYIVNAGDFFLYKNDWLKCSYNPPLRQEARAAERIEFIGLSGESTITLSEAITYFFLQTNTRLTVNLTSLKPATIIIKQNHVSKFTLSWPSNILWENKVLYTGPSTLNAMDIIKFYPLPETEHLLGKVVASNFQY